MSLAEHKCRGCGHMRSEHTSEGDGFFDKCQGKTSYGKCYCYRFQERYSKSKGEFITSDNDQPMCPHCGEYVHDWWDYSLHNDEDTTEVTCGQCEENFVIELRVEYKFNTFKTEKDYEDSY